MPGHIIACGARQVRPVVAGLLCMVGKLFVDIRPVFAAYRMVAFGTVLGCGAILCLYIVGAVLTNLKGAPFISIPWNTFA